MKKENNNIKLEMVESLITLPRALSNFVIDEETLSLRRKLIETKKYDVNSKELSDYKKKLPNLNEIQTSWALGLLLLGDASLQAYANSAFRLKMQQADFNKDLILATTLILRPWVVQQDLPIKQRKIGNYYVDFNTISHIAFKPLADILTKPEVEIKKGEVIKKLVPRDFDAYLDPVAIAAWFCCDGGRADYSKNAGKGIDFNTQGFDIDSCNNLARALRLKYKWNVRVILDYETEIETDKKQFFIVRIDASSFENVIEVLEPYLLDHFKKRLPTPRKKKGPKPKT